MENKRARISDLESTVRTLSKEKDELFDQLQLRQAELESSQLTAACWSIWLLSRTFRIIKSDAYQPLFCRPTERIAANSA